MAKPVKQVLKLPGRAVGEVLQATGVVPSAAAAPARAAATPVAPVQAPTAEDTRRVAPKTAVSLGGEDQMAATAETTRRRRASGMQTRSRGLTGAARTLRKTLLGQ